MLTALLFFVIKTSYLLYKDDMLINSPINEATCWLQISVDEILVIEGFRDGLTPESQHVILAFTWIRQEVRETQFNQLAGHAKL